MGNVIKFPSAPEWASAVGAKMLDRLVAKGYLQHRQRHDWCAVEMAINNVFYAAVFDDRPELIPRKVLEHMLDAAIEAGFRCLDCGLDTGSGPTGVGEYYSVLDEVWIAAGMRRDDDGMLCIGCLEWRLGRQLTHADFTNAPINKLSWDHSPRLRNRLGRGCAPKRKRPRDGQLDLGMGPAMSADN